MCVEIKIIEQNEDVPAIKILDCVQDCLDHFTKGIILDTRYNAIAKNDCLCCIDVYKTLVLNNYGTYPINFDSANMCWNVDMSPLWKKKRIGVK